ncbi:hypothetical protein SteCoe_22750 [Stentor coeruleus]|uniref:Uncharacterized protein n=1 Tax=Stentor coeruleus TaxID=5963 RepID=A0A1R2BLM3_9CILI|nr:hypothetical protein SteCoe_22750 [Stentor coeruleus]
MNALTIIKEELEEDLSDEVHDIIQKLMNELKIAIKRAEDSEEKLHKMENNDIRVKELMAMSQAKNAEIFALERKVKDLTTRAEEKDKQIISMLSMAKEFKILVESTDKGVQTDPVHNSEIEQKLIKSEEKNSKLKEMLISQIEEIQKLKSMDTNIKDTRVVLNSKKKIEAKVKPGGYYPLFLRKPKDPLNNQ